MKMLNIVIPILMHFSVQFLLKLEHCKLHKAAHHPMKCEVINDVKLFRKFLTRHITKASALEFTMIQ